MYLYILYVCLSAAYMRDSTCHSAHVGQMTALRSCFPPSTSGIPGSKFRLSGLAASGCTHEPSLLCMCVCVCAHIYLYVYVYMCVHTNTFLGEAQTPQGIYGAQRSILSVLWGLNSAHQACKESDLPTESSHRLVLTIYFKSKIFFWDYVSCALCQPWWAPIDPLASSSKNWDHGHGHPFPFKCKHCYFPVWLTMSVHLSPELPVTLKWL